MITTKIVKRTANIKDVTNISKKFNIDKKIAKLLLGRGYSENLIQLITSSNVELPSNNNVKGVEDAAYLIAEYIKDDNASVYVYADYDSDGVNAGFVMGDCLTKLRDCLETECEVKVHFPERSAGYGLSLEWCEQIVLNKKDRKVLVVTVDNGITKKTEVEYLLKNGVEVLITDHHMPKEDETPENIIIVNPHYTKDEESYGLCGTGVAYKICSFLLQDIFNDDSGYHQIYLPHVAIATITDMMPSTEENIRYIKHGMDLIEAGYCVAGINYYKTYMGKDKLNVKDIAWGLGAELNACGRMGNTKLASTLFIEENDDTVVDIYNMINNINEQRKAETKAFVKELDEIAQVKSGVVIAHYPQIGGLGGLVAAKAMEKYDSLVTIVLSGEGEVLHGSARGADGVNLHELFNEEVRKGNVLTFGGHESAVGLTVDAKKVNKLLDSLSSVIEAVIAKNLEEALANEELGLPQQEIIIEVDDEISISDITKKTADQYDGLYYFGQLKEPVFALKDVDVVSFSQSKSNPDNLKLTVKDATGKKDIWCWGFASTYEKLGYPKTISIIGTIEQDFMAKLRNKKTKEYTISVNALI